MNAIFLKTPYTAVLCLCSPSFDAYAVFDEHGPAQLLCAQHVWEALLTAFPLKCKRCLGPKGTRKRKYLQLDLHALACRLAAEF